MNNDPRKDDECNGCIYKPKLNSDNYPDECVMCSRWYSDGYTKDDSE